MIKNFRHKGLKQLFESGSHKGIEPSLRARLTIQLDALDAARHVRGTDVDLEDYH